MDLLVDLMHKGGPFMWLLLLLLGAAWVPVLLGMILLVLRKWAPAGLFWAIPLLLVAAGALGRVQGQIMAGEAVMHASPEVKSTLMHAGLAIAAYTEWCGWGLAAFVLCFSAGAVGLGLIIGAGEKARWSAVDAVIALLGGGAAVAAAVLAAMLQPRVFGSPGPELILPPLLVGVGGLGLVLACARSSDEQGDAGRLAAGRLLVLSMVVGSLVCMGLAGWLQGFSQVHEAISHAAPESRMSLAAAGAAASRAWLLPVAVAAVVMSVAGLLASVRTLRHALGGRHLISGLVLLLLAPGALALAGFGNYQAWELASNTAEARLARAVELVPELPRAVALGDDLVVEQPQAGFDRAVAWQGSGWRPLPGQRGGTADWELPIREHGGGPLLVVAPAVLPASQLLDTDWARGSDGPEVLSLLVVVDQRDGLQDDAEAWAYGIGQGMLELIWTPAEAWDAEEPEAREESSSLLDALRGMEPRDLGLSYARSIFVEGRSDGLAVHGLSTSVEVAADVGEAVTTVVEHVGEERPDTIALIPGSGWDLQDLVSHCLAATQALPDVDPDRWYQPPASCRMVGAVPEGLLEARQAELLVRGGGLGGLGQAVDASGVDGDPLVMGSLDKDVIESVIRRHLNQIRYCYQRELTKDPDLAGRVVIKFVVARDGTVSSANIKSSSMNNDAVETCIAGRFMRFRFPEPAGGGIVIVSYPFLFQPAQ